MRDKRYKWSDTQVRELTKLAKTKLSTTRIAKIMGITRGMVTGKLHRLGIKRSENSRKNPILVRLGATNMAVIKYTNNVNKNDDLKIYEDINLYGELSKKQCQYHTGGKKRWCGRKKYEDSKYPYCKEHLLICYPKTKL